MLDGLAPRAGSWFEQVSAEWAVRLWYSPTPTERPTVCDEQFVRDMGDVLDVALTDF